MTPDYRPPVPHLPGGFRFTAACPACQRPCVWWATAEGERPQCDCDEETAA